MRALLFDLDGTLADTERLGHRPAYNYAFKKLGLAWYWGPKLYRKLLKQPGGRERIRYYLERYKPELGEHAAREAEHLVHEVHTAKSKRFRSMVRRGRVPLRIGVSRLMQEARAAGTRIAVVTNASRATVQPLLDHCVGGEMAGAIAEIVCGEDGVPKKPAPDLYLLALRRLGVVPEECVAIEDSAMGLAAAVAAGIPTVVTVNDNTSGEDFSAAALVVDSLGEPHLPAQVLHGKLGEGQWVTLSQLSQLTATWHRHRLRA